MITSNSSIIPNVILVGLTSNTKQRRVAFHQREMNRNCFHSVFGPTSVKWAAYLSYIPNIVAVYIFSILWIKMYVCLYYELRSSYLRQFSYQIQGLHLKHNINIVTKHKKVQFLDTLSFITYLDCLYQNATVFKIFNTLKKSPLSITDSWKKMKSYYLTKNLSQKCGAFHLKNEL